MANDNMANTDKDTAKKDNRQWFEKETDEWDYWDAYDAACDLYEAHH